MRMVSLTHQRPRRGLLLAALALLGAPRGAASGQEPIPAASAPALPLARAQARARDVSAELTAARAAVAVATARERQGAAFTNPMLSVQREQTGTSGASNSQLITSIDQPIEIAGTRSARLRVLALRRGIAEAELVASEQRLDFVVAQAAAQLLAAERRAVLSRLASDEFANARATSDARFAAGDISGYTFRRIRLEAARYASLHAEAALAQRTAHRALARLLNLPADSLLRVTVGDSDARTASGRLVRDDSLRALATLHRPDLRAAMLGADAARAEIGLARRERLPLVRLTAGIKNEEVTGGPSRSGFVVGLALPLPLWDRNAGAIDVAGALTDVRLAEVDALRRRVVSEVSDAADAVRAIDAQLAVLRPQLGPESEHALRASRVAYAEGEISLLEWLDAVRAYHEAEVGLVALDAEAIIRRAALDRALGISLSRTVP